MGIFFGMLHFFVNAVTIHVANQRDKILMYMATVTSAPGVCHFRQAKNWACNMHLLCPFVLRPVVYKTSSAGISQALHFFFLNVI